MEADSEFKNINEAVKKLCIEAAKVDEALRNAEIEACTSRKALVASQEEYQQLTGEVKCLEAQVNKTNNDIKAQEKDIELTIKQIGCVLTDTKRMQKDNERIRNRSGRVDDVTKAAMQRMTRWEASAGTENVSTLQKELSAARERFAKLKDKRDALVKAPERVCNLQKSLEQLRTEKACLKMELEAVQKDLMTSEQKVDHIGKEVQVYEQRNRDHAAGLRKSIDEVSAHNAWLDAELSQMEAKVTAIKDKMGS